MAAMRLDRDAILGSAPRTLNIDDIPGIPGFLTIRELTSVDVTKIVAEGKRTRNKKEPLRTSSLYIIRSVVDENGELIFKDSDVDFIMERLGYKAVTYLSTRILVFNDLLDEDAPAPAKKDAEDAEDTDGGDSLGEDL